MKSERIEIHPINPQQRNVAQVIDILHRGGIVAMPTDASYVLICQLDDKSAVDRIRRIRQIDERHMMTLLCHDLSDVGQYARVDNSAYRLLKGATPGAYTFILHATKEVPRRLAHPSRKTIGLRVPNNKIAQAIIQANGEPLIGTTIILPGDSEPLTDADAINEKLCKQIDAIVDGGACGLIPTTVVDMTGQMPELVRQGAGDPAEIGL